MNSKFVSIDIETTGLNELTCQVIEIGAVIDDWLNPMENPPEFHCYVEHEVYKGEPYAFSMHADLFLQLAMLPKHNLHSERGALRYLHDWMYNNGAYQNKKAVVAGKNFAMFDNRFLRAMEGSEYLTYHHRVIDPGNLYWDPFTDEVLPDTKTCMKRAGIEGEVAHTALEDAKVVAKLVQIHAARQF